MDRPVAANTHRAAPAGMCLLVLCLNSDAWACSQAELHASQVPAGILLPDYAETATPTSELESRQQRTGMALDVSSEMRFAFAALLAGP